LIQTIDNTKLNHEAAEFRDNLGFEIIEV
jgi:hypothetical protein